MERRFESVDAGLLGTRAATMRFDSSPDSPSWKSQPIDGGGISLLARLTYGSCRFNPCLFRKVKYPYNVPRPNPQVDREAYNAFMRNYMRERYRKNADWVRAYKVEKGCVDCGYNAHHAGLEFDHREGRNGSATWVARLMGKSINRIKEEIAKCDVVCGTCHGVRTFERLQAAKNASIAELV